MTQSAGSAPSVTRGPRLPAGVQGALDRWHVDWLPGHPLPRAWKTTVATVVAVVGSLGADAFLVWFGTHLFPSTTGYVHFRFGDYARLTVIGVVVACAGWPVVARVTSTPRWLFFRMAVAVTLVLWSPDLYLLVRHQPPDAVAVLMLMHLAIAVVTYNALVHLAPAPDRGGGRRPAGGMRGARRLLPRAGAPDADPQAAAGASHPAGGRPGLETTTTP